VVAAGRTGLSVCCNSDLHWAFVMHLCTLIGCVVEVELPGGPLDGPADVAGGDGLAAGVESLLCSPLLRSAVAADSFLSALLALVVVEAS
jgi:hypothetical protein